MYIDIFKHDMKKKMVESRRIAFIVVTSGKRRLALYRQYARYLRGTRKRQNGNGKNGDGKW